MTEKHVFLSPTEAESLLLDGDRIHCMLNPAGGMFIGADWSRNEVIAAFETAKTIEIGGPRCKALGHPIVVGLPVGYRFFEADMSKVSAFEVSHPVSA